MFAATAASTLYKLFHRAMSEARVEVVRLHLGVDLIVIPVIVVEAVDRAATPVR